MALPTAGPRRSNFLYSFRLLPKPKREAMLRAYDFCRYTDDLVDEETTANKQELLAEWREEVEACYGGKPTHPVMRAMQDTVRQFNIPKEYILKLIDGVEMDLHKSRYETFEELCEYCYAVASVVGLISIQVFGFKHEQTREYAINLGYALQLTNILRDIKQDAAKNRIYLPLEDLRKFGYDEQSLLASRYDEKFIALMKFETDRAREYYLKARALLLPDERPSMIAAEIMDAIYYRILGKIERARYNVFTERIRISNPQKMLITLNCWMKNRLRWTR
jgi:15-cis-phytoene synthase